MEQVRRVLVRMAYWGCVVALFGASNAALASAPQCYPWRSSGYCQYTGQVSQAYANANGWILMFFDTPIDLNAPATVGLTGVTVNNASLYVMTENPDFARSLYASLLSAQARGAMVTVQMSTVADGYLHIDNIWVNQ
jgi:hypothetical protein